MLKRNILKLIIAVGITISFIGIDLTAGMVKEDTLEEKTVVLKNSIYLNENPPSEEWNRTYGDTYWDEAWWICEESSGDYTFVGSYTPPGHTSQVWLVRIDSNGNIIWDKKYQDWYESLAYSMYPTSDGGYIITGYICSCFGCDRDMLVIKVDSNGNEIWNVTLGGSQDDQGNCVIETHSGAYMVVGETKSFGAGGRDLWLVYIDSSGTVLWNKTFGGSTHDEGWGLRETSDGKYIITGSSLSYGGSANSIWLLKLDSFGNELWNKTFPGHGGHWVDETHDGGYILTGSSNGYSDVRLIKTDSNGNIIFSRYIGGDDSDYGNYVEELPDGSFIVAATTYSYGNGNEDAWIIKTDSNGNMIWNVTCGGIDDDYALCVRPTSDGGYIVAGITASYGAGSRDAWVIKYSTINNPPSTPSQPIGPTSGSVGENYTYTTVASDPDGDNIRYGWDWNGDDIIDEWTRYYPSGTLVSTTHSWDRAGVYYVKVKAEDSKGAKSDFSPPLTVTISANHPPNIPVKPVGPSTGEVEEPLLYSTSTTDPDGDMIRYGWDCDSDGMVDWWSNYYPSGATHQVTIIFHQPGVYYLRVKAEDINGAQSDYSPSKQVIITGANNPPDTPSRPSGPTTGDIGIAYTYTTHATDPNGDMIRYGWDWNGDGTIDEWTGYYVSGETISVTHSWSTAGVYYVKVKAEDEDGAQSDFSPPLTVNIGGNNPPDKPSRPSGPTAGRPGISYTYTASTTDPDGDRIYYKFSWGDGTTTEWLGPYNSGDIVSASHSWSAKGNYEVRVKAKDIHGLESEWSDPLPVAMPKYQWFSMLPPFLQRLLNYLL